MSIIRQPFRYQNAGTAYWLMGINALFYVAMYHLGFRDLIYYMSMIPGLVMEGWIWTFFTYMFVHGDFTHILFNMLALWIFGVPVERELGSKEFLLFYCVTGTLAGVFSFFSYCLMGNPNVALMGASGAIFALELAFAVLFPRSIIYIWGIIPMRAPVMVLAFTGLELFFSITGSKSGIAHLTHLAGFGFAWIYFLIRFRINPWTRLRYG